MPIELNRVEYMSVGFSPSLLTSLTARRQAMIVLLMNVKERDDRLRFLRRTSVDES